jgi:hypothetical protein
VTPGASSSLSKSSKSESSSSTSSSTSVTGAHPEARPRAAPPRHRPHGPPYSGPQLDAEVGMELRHATRNIKVSLLLVIGVLGGSVRTGFLRVVCEPRKGLPGGLIVRTLGAGHLHDPRLGSVVVCRGCVRP